MARFRVLVLTAHFLAIVDRRDDRQHPPAQKAPSRTVQGGCGTRKPGRYRGTLSREGASPVAGYSRCLGDTAPTLWLSHRRPGGASLPPPCYQFTLPVSCSRTPTTGAHSHASSSAL